jgi:hypothetical protein
LALDTVEQFQPLTEAERDELQQRAQGLQPFFEVAPA